MAAFALCKVLRSNKWMSEMCFVAVSGGCRLFSAFAEFLANLGQLILVADEISCAEDCGDKQCDDADGRQLQVEEDERESDKQH